MTRRRWKKYLPRKVKIGVSGRFSPIYGSAEWRASTKRTRRRKR